MNVIPVRVKKKVAYVFPGTLFSGPWSEELNRKTIGLRPAATVLDSFIEPPSQVISSFALHDRLSFECILRTSNSLLRRVPAPFPNVESDATHCINVSRASNLVMPEDSRLKKHPDSVCEINHNVASESIEHVL